MFLSVLGSIIKVVIISFILRVLIIQTNNFIVTSFKKPSLWILIMFLISFLAFGVSSFFSNMLGVIAIATILAYIMTLKPVDSKVADDFYKGLGVKKGRIKHKIAYWFYILGAILGWFVFFGSYYTGGKEVKIISIIFK